ncbi:hypothetical protein F0249_07820 [Vibrio sp. 03-59-1]|uniref:hypothetical protein n=1 Tax=Vibrio sp. 03-59-1 TaxID=2607607 RepID=UPI0014935AD5|nr:hypothetical protein [Vibrio sp. 03-59-1]NOH83717.1 hypothetical protein [Vibrio sp. 03-59-1]
MFIEKYQWFYAALSGYSATSLLVLTNVNPANFGFLLIFATIAFAVCLPVFATFSMTYWIFLKYKVPQKNVALLINSPKSQQATTYSMYLIALASLLLIIHLSYLAGIAAAVALHFSKKFQSYCLYKVGITNQWLDAVERSPGNVPNLEPN